VNEKEIKVPVLLDPKQTKKGNVHKCEESGCSREEQEIERERGRERESVCVCGYDCNEG
jgi:hypothetical protein